MRAKRIISLITIAVFLSTAFFTIPAFAAEADMDVNRVKLMMAAGEIPPVTPATEMSVKIKRDEAGKIARTFLEDASQFELSSAFLNLGYGSASSLWSVSFSRKSNPASSANVNIDADTGEIIGFNIWSINNGQQNYVARFTRAEALSAANDFLKNKLKYVADDYELQPGDPYEDAYRMGGVKQSFVYSFTYVRKLNGILLPADTVYVGVDGTSGEVTSLNRNSAPIDMSRLPSGEKALSREEILARYKTYANFALQYITQYQDKLYGVSKQKVVLAYVPSYYSDLLDAERGVPVNYDGSQIVVGNTDKYGVNSEQLNPAAVLPAPAAKTGTEAGAIADGCSKTIEKLLGVKLGNAVPIEQAYQPQDGAWYFNWNQNSEGVNCNAGLAVNKTTGRISSMSFSKYDNSYELAIAAGQAPSVQKIPEVNAKVTWSDGKKKALEAVRQLVPEQYGFFADQSLREPDISAEVSKTLREYSYYFIRTVNGILFRDNTMSINIDRETGEVKSFYMNWTDGDFPQAASVITKDAAAAKYFDGMEARLQYLSKVSYDQQSQSAKYEPAPMLVYSIVRKGSAYGGGVYVDAVSGSLMDSGGREIKPAASAAEPAPGYDWAKRSVELLKAQGIIKNSDIDYGLELTRAEAVKMLSGAKGNQYYYDYNQINMQSFPDVPKDSEYYAYVENAVAQGIIEKGAEFRGEEKITREEFAKLLVNMTGYAELAVKPSVFKTDGLNVTDPADAGYVAICSALGFLPVKPGEAFDGGGRLTLAEAAAALYKALAYIR